MVEKPAVYHRSYLCGSLVLNGAGREQPERDRRLAAIAGDASEDQAGGRRRPAPPIRWAALRPTRMR